MTDRPRSARFVLVRNVAWNYVGFLYETGVGIALVAYIARRVPVSHYGVFLLASSVAALLLLLDFGLPAVLVPTYVGEKVRGGAAAVSRVLKSATAALAASGFLGLSICIVVARFLPGPFHIGAELVSIAATVFVLIGLLVQIAMPARAFETAYAAFHRFDTLNRIQVLVATLRLVLTIWLLSRGAGVVGLAVAQLAATAARLALLVALLRPSTGVRPWAPGSHREILPPLLRNGRWALLDTVSRQVSLGADPIILGMFASMGSVALYGVGSRLPLQLANLVRKGVVVTMPDLAAGHAIGDVPNVRRTFVTTARTVATVILPVVLLLMILADDIVLVWVGPSYAGAVPVLRWLLVVTLIQVVSIPSDLVLYARYRFSTAARVSFGESLFKLALAVILVRPYGGAGLAAATAISHVCVTLLWFGPAACRAAELAPRKLAAALVRDASLPAAVMLLLLVALRVSGAGPVQSLVAGTLALLLYALVWFLVAGRSLLRGAQEVVETSNVASR